MIEILPGLWHWTAPHPHIGARVSSYWVEPAGLVIDPITPEEGIEAAFDGRPQPQQIALTSGHHDRDAAAFAEAFGGIPIRGARAAQDRLDGKLDLQPWRDGEDVAPGVVAVEIGVLCPDEAALHLTGVEGGALAVADAVNNYGEALAFFSDDLLGDDPEQIKAGLKNRLRAQLDREFDTLLFAHGEPLVGGGKAALRDFVSA